MTRTKTRIDRAQADRTRADRAQADNSSGGQASLWKWAAGAGSAAAVLGAAAYNLAAARRTEEDNPPLGRFIRVDGVDLHYLEEGTGPVIVLIHGNGTMIEDWLASGIFQQLAKTNRVIAFDRPGFGHSSRPRSAVWTPAAQAGLIASALASLDVAGATVVGHSFGTMVAAALGLHHPEAAGSLVLISGYYYPSARLDAILAAPPAVPIVGDAIRFTISPLMGSALQHRLESKMFAPAPVSAGWRSAFPFQMTLRPSQIRAAAADAALMVPAAAALPASDLRMPVTIIAGKGDEVVPPEQSERLGHAIAGSRLLVVEGAGHMVHHTAAEEVAAEIRTAARRPGTA